MAESIIDCLDKKAKLRFFEANQIMTEALREDIIKDTGHPKLKAKCLDVITKLRIEANVLNITKTARAPLPVEPPASSKEFEESAKEPLGLDENG